MTRYALIIEYDGTPFQGWQIQPEGPTVQAEVEKALATCLRKPTGITGSGRTDTGVHARFQVAHFDSDEQLDTHKLYKSLNGLLSSNIAVRDALEVAPDFHARYDAIQRTYRYHIGLKPTALEKHIRLWVPSTVDMDRMRAACKHLIGKHDYSTFCKIKSETTNRTCNVSEATWVDEGAGRFHLQISADRFLHGMVRAITGTLLEVGQGKREVDSIPDLLLSKDRTLAGPAARPHGLVLHYVTYPDGALPYAE